MSLISLIAATNLPPIADPLPHVTANSDVVSKVLTIVFGATGAIALLIITIAGLRFTLSAGDPQATSRLRNTIIYAALGLVVSIFAFTLVTFFIGRL